MKHEGHKTTLAQRRANTQAMRSAAVREIKPQHGMPRQPTMPAPLGRTERNLQARRTNGKPARARLMQRGHGKAWDPKPRMGARWSPPSEPTARRARKEERWLSRTS